MSQPTISNDPDGFGCYSDHGEDIRTLGGCTMCGSSDTGVVGHVLPGVERLTGVDPVTAAQAVLAESSMKFVDGVLLDLQTAHVIVTVFNALSQKEAKAKLRRMTVTKAGTVCWKLATKRES